MNADNDFQIGHSHIVCEDYSLSGVLGWNGSMKGYAIISDGCSASADVDFGARILALSARELLSKIDSDILGKKNGMIDYIEYGSQIIQRANTIPPLFPNVSERMLDATLLSACFYEGEIKVYMFGDGVFYHKNNEGVNITHVSFTNNAPNYLSYLLDGKRKGGYLELKGGKEITSYKLLAKDKEPTITTKTIEPFDPVMFSTPAQDGDLISLCSDGINSFRHSDYTPIPWHKLLDDYFGYKNFEGSFVKRRMAAFKRKCIKEGITHSDDISVASIIV